MQDKINTMNDDKLQYLIKDCREDELDKRCRLRQWREIASRLCLYWGAIKSII